jgi:hypothetical protein
LSALVCVSERVGVPLEQPARGHVDERVAARVHVSLHRGVALGDFNLEQVAKVLEYLTDQRDVCCASQHHLCECRKVSTWDEHSSEHCVSQHHLHEGVGEKEKAYNWMNTRVRAIRPFVTPRELSESKSTCKHKHNINVHQRHLHIRHSISPREPSDSKHDTQTKKKKLKPKIIP